MAAWQDPKEVLLSDIDVTKVEITDLKAAIDLRVEQIKEHLEGIQALDLPNTLHARQLLYDALLEIDSIMKTLEQYEQNLAEQVV